MFNNSKKQKQSANDNRFEPLEIEEERKISLKEMPIDTRWERVYLILSLVIPTSLSQIVNIMVEVMNLKFVGELNDPAMFAGVGMGNMTQNLCALSIILGFNSALDTLVSQSAGAGDI